MDKLMLIVPFIPLCLAILFGMGSAVLPSSASLTFL